MFMVDNKRASGGLKDEWVNIRKLLKVKLQLQKKVLPWFLSAWAFMFISSIASPISTILYNNSPPGLSYYNMPDFSVTFFFGLIIAYITLMFLYRSMNDKLSVFPQTNTSRFVTTQAGYYIAAIILALISLISYLCYYGSFKLLSHFAENIYFALNFNAGFVIAGFFTFLIYIFIIIATLELIGTILRRWTYYAIVILTSLVVLGILYIGRVIEYLPSLLSFIVREQSFGLFMVKAIGLWLAIVAVSLIINRYTVYNNSRNILKIRRVAITSIAIGVIVVIVVPLVILSLRSDEGNNTGQTSVTNHETEREVGYKDNLEIFHVDVSHLPKGSRINLMGKNIDIGSDDTNFTTVSGPPGRPFMPAYIGGKETLDSLDTDTLVIEFRPPFYEVNGIEFAGYADPQLDVRLIGDTLRIDYKIKNTHIAIIPIWGIARQFEAWKGKDIFVSNLIGHIEGGSMNANVYISAMSDGDNNSSEKNPVITPKAQQILP